jgi:hypothetical protein
MLKAISDLKGAALAATDGEIGSVADVYIDAASWTVRYLVVDTGTWLPGRKVLISPLAVRGAVWGADRIPVNLTKAQVEASPSVDTEQPVSRQYELEYARYYGYPSYWGGPYRWGTAQYPADVAPLTGPPYEPEAPREPGDPHLHSARDLMGSYIEATDGDIGHVEDFLVDDREWAVRYMVVDTRNWLPGKKVLVSPEWIRDVSWADSRVYVDLTRQGVESAPEYDPDRPLERADESRLYRHYQRRQYWE